MCPAFFVARGGNPSQAWASQSPHDHHYTDDDMYPDASVEDASNYTVVTRATGAEDSGVSRRIAMYSGKNAPCLIVVSHFALSTEA